MLINLSDVFTEEGKSVIREVPLEIGGIILCVPQAELHEAEQINFFLCIRSIL